VVEGPEVPLQDLGPPCERRRELAADSEGEVDIRPGVPTAGDLGARDRRGGDPLVAFGQGQQAPPCLFPLLGREHRLKRVRWLTNSGGL